jgi:hypothetical protein
MSSGEEGERLMALEGTWAMCLDSNRRSTDNNFKLLFAPSSTYAHDDIEEIHGPI